MTIVRMKVAKSGFTFSMPIFAKMAVSAAKAANGIAQTCHYWKRFIAGSSQPTVRETELPTRQSPMGSVAKFAVWTRRAWDDDLVYVRRRTIISRGAPACEIIRFFHAACKGPGAAIPVKRMRVVTLTAMVPITEKIICQVADGMAI